MTVYLDLVVLLNFLVDFLLLCGTNRLFGYRAGAKRCAVAAVLGGLYAGACMLPGFRFLGAVFWRLLCLMGMTVIAYGWGKSALRRGALFLFLSFALGGAAMGNGTFWGILVAAGLICLLCFYGFRGRPGEKTYVPVKLEFNGKERYFTALVDTGNTLTDPLTGRSVLVVGSDIAREMLGLTEDALGHPLETITRAKDLRLRLIPYRAVGQPAGFLLAICPDKLTVGKELRQDLVAFAPQEIGRGEVFDALAGGVL